MVHVGIFRRLQEGRALREVTERLESCERQLKQLRIEWEDAYDRLRHVMGRLNKRAAREAEDGGAPQTNNQPADPGLGRPMTAREAALWEIAKRRGGQR
jgi:hypothetical protein